MSETSSSGAKRKATTEELINLRLAIGHTQKEAAAFLYVTERTYQNWEYKNSMPLAIFELYQLKAMARGLIRSTQVSQK